MHPLFREPLRYDALTWLWIVLVAGVYVAHLQLPTWVSASTFVVGGVVVSSVFVLLVAVVRYLVDGPQRRVRGARTVREVLGIDVLPGVGDWNRREAAAAAAQSEAAAEAEPEAEDVRPAATRPVAAAAPPRERLTVRLPAAVEPEPQPEPHPAPGPPTVQIPVAALAALVPSAPPRERPRALRVEVSEVRVEDGTPVTVTWSFEGADTVVVDGRTGFPSHGRTTVALRHTRPVVLIGANAAGVTAVSTPEVEVVSEPQPAVPPPARPVPPVQRLQLDLRGNAEGTETVLARLDAVMRAQDELRPYTAAPVRPLGVPSSFTRWLRGHPQQRFVSPGSYLDALTGPPPGRRGDPTAAGRRGTAAPETDRTAS